GAIDPGALVDTTHSLEREKGQTVCACSRPQTPQFAWSGPTAHRARSRCSRPAFPLFMGNHEFRADLPEDCAPLHYHRQSITNRITPPARWMRQSVTMRPAT